MLCKGQLIVKDTLYGCSQDHKSQTEATSTWPTKAISLFVHFYIPMRFVDNKYLLEKTRDTFSLSGLANNTLAMCNSTINPQK